VVRGFVRSGYPYIATHADGGVIVGNRRMSLDIKLFFVLRRQMNLVHLGPTLKHRDTFHAQIFRNPAPSANPSLSSEGNARHALTTEVSRAVCSPCAGS
jgi:hypothetical protein